mmetsp:Transcript_37849/g.113149  ORF Transcript_37849/g.113149 Transcript_37849/m.113149 type:complete len:225 (-) Transcript_37849:145-819(-)
MELLLLVDVLSQDLILLLDDLLPMVGGQRRSPHDVVHLLLYALQLLRHARAAQVVVPNLPPQLIDLVPDDVVLVLNPVLPNERLVEPPLEVPDQHPLVVPREAGGVEAVDTTVGDVGGGRVHVEEGYRPLLVRLPHAVDLLVHLVELSLKLCHSLLLVDELPCKKIASRLQGGDGILHLNLLPRIHSCSPSYSHVFNPGMLSRRREHWLLMEGLETTAHTKAIS